MAEWRKAGAPKASSCKRCQRARWMMTVLTLATMLVILYLHQPAS